MNLLNRNTYFFILITSLLFSTACFAENNGDKNDHKKAKNKAISDSIYDVEKVDLYPQFPGGNGELRKYITTSLNYPSQAAEDASEGLVIVKLVVDGDGKIADPKIAYSADPSFEKEALRLVKKMPKWHPGQKDGQKVNVRVTLPIMFKAQY